MNARSDISTAPLVSVIIVSYNTRDLLAQCVQSLQEATRNLPLEIIVVDNASLDGSADMCRTLPGVQVIENSENVGFGRANNQGIRLSRGEFVLLLNSDTVVLPGAVERMVESLTCNSTLGVLGCRILNGDGSDQASCFRFPNLATVAVERLLLYRLWRSLPQTAVPRSGENLMECDWTSGACMLIRRAALEAAGTFDPNIWLYGEEVDLCYRIKKSGWSIAADLTAQIVHFGGASWDQASYSATLLKIAGLLCFCSAHLSRPEYYASYVLAGFGAALRALICATMAILTPNRRQWHVRELRCNILLLVHLGRGTVLNSTGHASSQ